jgi:hypothetical protein
MAIKNLTTSGSSATVKDCIGLYFSLDAIYISTINISGKVVKAGNFTKIPLVKVKVGDTVRMSAMHVHLFYNESLWLAPLKSALDKIKLKTNNVVVTLSPQFAVARHFIMPRVDQRFWGQSIPIEAKKYVPFVFEEPIHDYHVYSLKSKEREKMGVLFATTSSKMTKAISVGLKKLGLNIKSIEVSSISVERFWSLYSGEMEGGKIHVHFDDDTAYLILSYNGIPLLSREVNFSDSQTTERRRLDVRGSIDYISKQMGFKVFDKIMLSGKNLELWKAILEEDSKLPVKIWNPKKALSVETVEWGVFASVGAAVRFKSATEIEIDLSGEIKQTEDDKKALGLAWKISTFLVVAFLVLSMFTVGKSYVASRKLARLKGNVAEVPEFKGKKSQEIEKLIENTKRKSLFLSGNFGKKHYVTKQLESIVNTLPDDAWITEINYSRKLKIRPMDRYTVLLNLKGMVSEGDPGRNVQIASDFKESFEKSPPIADLFGGGKGTVEIKYQTTQAKDRKMSLEDTLTTVFNLECVRRI